MASGLQLDEAEVRPRNPPKLVPVPSLHDSNEILFLEFCPLRVLKLLRSGTDLVADRRAISPCFTCSLI